METYEAGPLGFKGPASFGIMPTTINSKKEGEHYENRAPSHLC